MQTTIRVSALSVALLTLLGCAAPPAKKDPRDPWERMNRTTYKFNDKLDKAVLRPLARGYRDYTPQFFRTGVSNFLDNLEYPIVIVNDLLQARFKPFVRDTGRLLMNTTLGIGGLLDPATEAGLEKNENDFGLTLGHWGLGTGPYLVIPFLGPSDVRDGLGRVPDGYASPQNYIDGWQFEYSIWALHFLDARYRLLSADQALDSAYDPYLFLKNAYLQRRAFLLHGGNAPANEEEQEEKLLEEAGQDTGDESTSPKPVPPDGQPPEQQTPPQPDTPPPH
jgi:phospholipid-binding lipoprotein MlaA